MNAFFGHLHPLLVHLPIGILLLAFVMECMARWMRQPHLRMAIHVALFLGLVAAILSALSGWSLSQTNSYAPEILERHRYLGFFTAGLFLLVYLLRANRFYFPIFLLGIASLILTGHYGGSLTHGSDFLFAETAETTAESPGEMAAIGPETLVYQDIIQPILKQKCVSCHKPSKRKGGLDLSTEAAILQGGKHGPVINLGALDSSKMLLRIHLQHKTCALAHGKQPLMIWKGGKWPILQHSRTAKTPLKILRGNRPNNFTFIDWVNFVD